jgi:hypothetical protein
MRSDDPQAQPIMLVFRHMQLSPKWARAGTKFTRRFVKGELSMPPQYGRKKASSEYLHF